MKYTEESIKRAFLMADGFAIVMEGDPLRDPDLAKIGEKILRKKSPDISGPEGVANQTILESYHLDRGGLSVWTEDLIKYVVRCQNKVEVRELIKSYLCLKRFCMLP